MSIYEKNYVRWYLKTHKKKFLFIAMFLFVCLPMVAILTPEEINTSYFSVPFMNETMMYAILMFIFVICVPIYNFHFLMEKRSVDTYLAMPIKRKRFFTIQFILGIIAILFFVNAAFLLALLCEPLTWDILGEFLLVMLYISITAICLYAMYSYLIMKCNNLWDAIAICIAYTILPILVFSALNTLITNALSSFLISQVAIVEEVFPSSSIWMTMFSVPAFWVYTIDGFVSSMYEVHNNNVFFYTTFMSEQRLLLVCLWMSIGIVCYLRARVCFSKRSGEESGQRTTSRVCYPVAIVLITASLLMNDGISFQFFTNIFNILFIFVLYLLMVFFAKRKIALSKRSILVFVGLMISVMSINFVFTSTRGFGKIHELPAFEDIAIVEVYFNSRPYSVTIDGEVVEESPYSDLFSEQMKGNENIEDVYALHEMIAKEAKKSSTYYEGEYLMTVIVYTLQDGSSMRREYRYDDETMKEKIHPYMMEMIDKGYFDESIKNQKLQNGK